MEHDNLTIYEGRLFDTIEVRTPEGPLVRIVHVHHSEFRKEGEN